MGYYISNNELYHFGIKGQKWGIRRYQNPDGTYTELGKKRLRAAAVAGVAAGAYVAAKNIKNQKRINDNLSADEKKYRELQSKRPEEMSNNEISEYNKRYNLKSTYNKNNPVKMVAVATAVIGGYKVISKFLKTEEGKKMVDSVTNSQTWNKHFFKIEDKESGS